jgi:hypothetical protein
MRLLLSTKEHTMHLVKKTVKSAALIWGAHQFYNLLWGFQYGLRNSKVNNGNGPTRQDIANAYFGIK